MLTAATAIKGPGRKEGRLVDHINQAVKEYFRLNRHVAIL